MQYAMGSHLIPILILGVLIGVNNGEVSKRSNRYLAHIFNKYGSHGTINFEGLEHLMHNLQLGALEFSPSHTVDEHRPKNFTLPDIHIEESTISSNSPILERQTVGEAAEEERTKISANSVAPNFSDDMWNEDLWSDVDFTEMHDPKHRHPRHHDHNINSCLSPLSVLGLAIQPASPTIKITPTMFLEMCPALLVQLDQRSCSVVINAVPPTVGFGKAWLYASISIVLISMCGLVGVAIVPLVKSDAYQDVLRFLVALAVGTLCGDALMHLLPHSLAPHTHEDVEGVVLESLFTDGDIKFEPVWLCFCAFMSALFMFALETMLPLLGQSTSHSHGHSHHTTHNHHDRHETELVESQLGTAAGENKTMLHREPPVATKKRSKLSPVAFMVILGDGLHNITDGMAIGAAFALDPVTGMATALAVLCHELPHELGDFALLLQTGVSVRKAVVFNILSSVLSVFGMIVGLVVAGVDTTMVRWIYAGTAGTFLYIALADLVPEMRRESVSGEQRRLASVLIDVTGILLGGLLMLVIAMYEEKLQLLFK